MQIKPTENTKSKKVNQSSSSDSESDNWFKKESPVDSDKSLELILKSQTIVAKKSKLEQKRNARKA